MSLKGEVQARDVPGSFLGFSDLFSGEKNNHRRRGGNVEIAQRFPRAGGNEGKPGFGFPRFPRPGISTALPGFMRSYALAGSRERACAWLLAFAWHILC